MTNLNRNLKNNVLKLFIEEIIYKCVFKKEDNQSRDGEASSNGIFAINT